MKKVLCLVLCLALLSALLISCGSDNLPKGKASDIQFVDGSSLRNVDFKYVNETTVKITRDNGTVIYVPTTYIERINVAK